MYCSFAYIYDRLMHDVDYTRWADYLESLFSLLSLKPKLIVDLGCGTGSLTLLMARRGYEMIGIDQSPDMLACARQKSEKASTPVQFLNQDMTAFKLFRPADAMVCLMDSVNHVTRLRDLKRMLERVHRYLNPGGAFIFDINTPYKLEKLIGSNIFYEIGDDVAYLWRSSFQKKRRVCVFDMTFFVRRGEYYERFDEVIRERSYTVRELHDMLKEAGFEVRGVYDRLSLKPAESKSERAFFVCRKQV